MAYLKSPLDDKPQSMSGKSDSFQCAELLNYHSQTSNDDKFLTSCRLPRENYIPRAHFKMDNENNGGGSWCLLALRNEESTK